MLYDIFNLWKNSHGGERHLCLAHVKQWLVQLDWRWIWSSGLLGGSSDRGRSRVPRPAGPRGRWGRESWTPRRWGQAGRGDSRRSRRSRRSIWAAGRASGGGTEVRSSWKTASDHAGPHCWRTPAQEGGEDWPPLHNHRKRIRVVDKVYIYICIYCYVLLFIY